MPQNDDPDLPELPAANELRESSPTELEDRDQTLRERHDEVKLAMAPLEAILSEIKSRRGVIATELRRRERAETSARRRATREAAASGEFPSLLEALAGAEIEDERPLAEVKAFLRTGGAVGFGFATRPGSITFTDGKQQKAAATWGEARTLYAQGWNPGSASIPGVRVHLAGTRVEKVVTAEEVAINPS